MPLAEVDPQGRLIWVRTEVSVPRALAGGPAPLGIHISAKASSRLWLNGTLVGANGIPAPDRAGETPGRMDALIPARSALLGKGTARIDLLMSAHHGFVHLASPVHFVALGPYAPPRFWRLIHYWPSLVTFGALLAGGFYFAAAAFGRENRRSAIFLSAIALFAAAQLFAEAARGLFAYTYPLHDARLILIYLFSLGFGVMMTAAVLSRFERRIGVALAIIAGLTLLLSLPVPGFDDKSALAMLVPAVACALLALRWAVQRRPKAAQYLAALIAFVLAIVAAPVLFLDLLFYVAVAVFLLFLFVQQALLLADERRLRRDEAERAGRLALALERRTSVTDASITVVGTGRTERVPVEAIASIRGAGDYAELCLLDGRELLHADTLNGLEAALPQSFVRVHRSHIVNTAHVRALEREPTGVGLLRLTNGAEVPVSRRILPSVRAALDP